MQIIIAKHLNTKRVIHNYYFFCLVIFIYAYKYIFDKVFFVHFQIKSFTLKLFIIKMSKKFGERTTALEVIEGHDLTGKEIIITGAASGIGVETARALARAGARVIIAARDLKRANEVKDDIIKTTGNQNVEVEELELGSLKSIDKFVERFLATKRPLHILINNAGIMNSPQGATEDGFELQFGVNHVGHFALTIGLLPALKAAKKSRVVVVSSLAHTYSDIVYDDIHFKNRPYEGFQSYG
jgi:hypothetical protein